mmetsp:Transcript_115963/g.300631  ORF Transcript_115963/g.300631 Transcript_115963/m.300631 type:complete len:233 (+) Transcript_115963:900-1598(+)
MNDIARTQRRAGAMPRRPTGEGNSKENCCFGKSFDTWPRVFNLARLTKTPPTQMSTTPRQSVGLEQLGPDSGVQTLGTQSCWREGGRGPSRMRTAGRPRGPLASLESHASCPSKVVAPVSSAAAADTKGLSVATVARATESWPEASPDPSCGLCQSPAGHEGLTTAEKKHATVVNAAQVAATTGLPRNVMAHARRHCSARCSPATPSAAASRGVLPAAARLSAAIAASCGPA